MTTVQDLAIDLSFRDLTLGREAIVQARNTVTGVSGVIVTLEAILYTDLVRDGDAVRLVVGTFAAAVHVITLWFFLRSNQPQALDSQAQVDKLTSSDASSVRDEKARLAKAISDKAGAAWTDLRAVEQRALGTFAVGAVAFAVLGVLSAQPLGPSATDETTSDNPLEDNASPAGSHMDVDDSPPGHRRRRIPNGHPVCQPRLIG